MFDVCIEVVLMSTLSDIRSGLSFAVTLQHTVPAWWTGLLNFVEKGDNAGKQHFLLFQQCFFHLTNQRHKSLFSLHFNRCLQMFSVWNNMKFCNLIKS